MDYFKILNLNREPFSNSPEPEFFFLSTVHLACLQQLELAIRLRRGLNVVMGEVGTGKTTLCRQLILRFTESEEDRQEIETHLLLDPSFSTPREFLASVAVSFGIPEMESAKSEWQIKEDIKIHLFLKGVDQRKTVVLIIDEGQKLPGFCREILREFLNYETNENKLLQIVIFAQNEFQAILKGHKNFADRVNRCYFLGPLNFKETRAMIRFRLSRAGRPADGPRLFTFPALWFLYRATGGHPRRIITLCHQILLAVIIQNRVRADCFLVLSTTKRLTPDPGRPKRWTATTTALATVLFLAVIALWYAPAPQNIVRHSWPPVQTAPRSTPAEKSKPFISPAYTATAPPAQLSVNQDPGQTVIPPAVLAKSAPDLKPEKVVPVETARKEKVPDQLGQLKIREGGTILHLLQEIYGDIRSAPFQAFIRANPHIPDINRVLAGETIHFPAIPTSSPFLAPEKIWVQIARKSGLEEAYRIYKDYPADMPPIRLIPSWNRRDGMVFVIFLKKFFHSEAEAQNVVRNLLPALAAGAEIMRRPEKDTLFFAN
jgi:general secretion pathway protein A